MALAVISISLIHLIKLVLNWKVYNILHPDEAIEPKVTYPGWFFLEKEENIQKFDDSTAMFMMSMYIFFWMRIPEKNPGKNMAWAVLVLSIIQIALIGLVIYLAPESTQG